MADYIPFVLQAEIMKRLPVISLIRFRSVSKQWKSLIDSPEFIAQHCVIQHHTQSQHHLLLSYVESVSGVGMSRYISIVDDDTFPHQKVLMTTPLCVKRKRLIGVSGGLFCFYGSIREGVHNAVFWNPSIKKTVTISVPNVPDDVPFGTMVGFSVCPRTSDPRLVKITYLRSSQKEYATIPIPNQVEVFSLSSGLWKPLPTGKLPPRKPTLYMDPQVPINDSIYWLAYDRSSPDWKFQDDSRFIMSFDFTTQEFTQVYLPPALASSKTRDVSISKLNNHSLVVIELTTPRSNANVWIMHNNAPHPPSFIHTFTINIPILDTTFVAGFRNNGAPLLSTRTPAVKNQFELTVYDPTNSKHTGIAGPFYSFVAKPYTQTLLLLHRKDSVDLETKKARFFRRLGRTLTSSATSSSTSYYYGATKRRSQEEEYELYKKKQNFLNRRVSACVNNNLVIGKEDEEYHDEAMLDVDDGVEVEVVVKDHDEFEF